jgi:hypothetical protein
MRSFDSILPNKEATLSFPNASHMQRQIRYVQISLYTSATVSDCVTLEQLETLTLQV